MSPRAKLRAALAGDTCIVPGSVFDAPSAIMAETLGFEAGILAGSVASLTLLGAPDIILLTATEFVDLARRICRATDLPLVCDADHGYGNALNVMRTVADLEAAGISALTIEDTSLPRPFGATTTQLIPLDEGVGKIRAALAARRDPNLVIAGRTSAMDVAGLDEAIDRIRAYEAAGADAVFLSGVKTHAQIEAACAAVHVPIMLGGLPPDLADPAQLAKFGVRFNIIGHQPYLAALQATHDTLKAIRQGAKPSDLANLLSEDARSLVERRSLFTKYNEEFLK